MKLALFTRLSVGLLCTMFGGEIPFMSTDSVPRPTPLTRDVTETTSQDFIWPTDGSHTITSTFGEFRRRHFHAGIDISTNSRSGYRVFAARDGYVWRVSVSPTGYGKALYVKHADGLITVYAHLKTFNDAINQLVRDEQKRWERYPIDLMLEPSVVPVKQGEVIAYSGNSGIQTPHLHFEIRDENLNPINPQLFNSLRKEDNLLPQLRSFVVLPLDHHSSVAGRRKPLILNAFAGRSGDFHFQRKITARGRVGFGIDVRDRIDGTYHRGGIYRLELYLNDSLSFSAQFDRLIADGSKEVLSHYNLPLLNRRGGRFQQLFREHSTLLPIYVTQADGAGVIDARMMGEGEHRFRVVCKDIRGNTTTLSGTIVLSHAEEQQPSFIAGNPHENGGERVQSVFSIPSDSSGWFSFDGHAMQIVYDSGAVFKRLNVLVEKLQQHDITMYRLLPQDVLLNKGIRVFLRPPKPTMTLALYERSSSRFELCTTAFDSSTGYYSTTLTTTLRDIALLEDDEEPRLSRLNLTLNKKRPVVRFHVYDNLSGIDAKEIKTYIDGDFVIPEIDNRWRVVAIGEPLAKGKHELIIVVKDNIGNSALIKKLFDVK